MREKLAKMQEYFIKYLGFETPSGEALWKDDDIEYECHLVNHELGLWVDFEKRYDENECESVLRGNSEAGQQIMPYLQYFLYRGKIEIPPDRKRIFDEIEANLSSTKPPKTRSKKA